MRKTHAKQNCEHIYYATDIRNEDKKICKAPARWKAIMRAKRPWITLRRSIWAILGFWSDRTETNFLEKFSFKRYRGRLGNYFSIYSGQSLKIATRSESSLLIFVPAVLFRDEDFRLIGSHTNKLDL